MYGESGLDFADTGICEFPRRGRRGIYTGTKRNTENWKYSTDAQDEKRAVWKPSVPAGLEKESVLSPRGAGSWQRARWAEVQGSAPAGTGA